MKKSLLLLFLFAFSYNAKSQLFGNSSFDGNGNYSDGYTTFWRIHTGSSDSGNFTHLGLYIDPSNYSDLVTMAIYSSSAVPKPQDLLGTVGYVDVVNGVYNEFSFSSSVPLSPDTDYFIAIKGEYQINSGRVLSENWPYVVYYYASWWAGGFPDPAPSGLSGITSANKQAIYAIANNIGLLPISLSAFQVNNKNNEAILKWETISEVNNKGWNIQKSTNGFTYKTIGWIDGANTSNSENTYRFIDSNTSNGMNIYRLEQVDFDGKKSYSEHRTIFIENNEISFYPNPVKDIIHFNINIDTKITIINSNGEIVYENKVVSDKLNLTKLKSGYYVMMLNNKRFSFIKVE